MKTQPLDQIDSFASTEGGEGNYLGLNKREYFTGLAMQGMVSAYKEIYSSKIKEIAENSVLMADYLIEALNKESTP